MRTCIHWAWVALSACLLSSAAFGQHSYPNKSIRLIVPYASGQGTDLIGRYLGQELGTVLHQSIVIDNKPGAGGNIGTQQVARSAPDGYTLVLGTNATHAANSFLYAQTGYNPRTDFKPIAMVGILPLVFATRAENPVGNIEQLVAVSRDGGRELDMAASTNTARMAFELFKARSGARVTSIDYKGSSQALTDMLGGHVNYMVDTIASLRPFIERGQAKALGVTSARSTALLPQVKSLAEQGIAGYELVGWNVLYAPSGIPAEVEKTLVQAAQKVLERPDVQERLLGMGIQPLLMPHKDLQAFVGLEFDKWGKLIEQAGLKHKQ